MAVQNTPPQLRIIICGATIDERSRLARQFGDIDGKYLVTDIGDGEDSFQNLVSASTSADLVIIATDALHGFVTRCRRHIKIASVLGVRNFLLVANKNGNAGFEQSRFTEIKHQFDQYLAWVSQGGGGTVTGTTILSECANTSWYEGPTLPEYLSAFENQSRPADQAFRMPVDSVSGSGRPASRISGKVLSGAIFAGDPVVILPAAARTKIDRIICNGKNVEQIHAGQSGELSLADKLELAPGDMICAADQPVEAADQFETTIIWMSQEPMMSGRPYSLKSTTNTLDASITTLKYSINVDSHEHVAANRLEKGEIGVCNISLSRRVPFEPFNIGRETGQFTLFDKETDNVIGVGAIHFALRRSSNVHWQALDVTRQTRARLKGQKPAILWFTGLSGSGKSAIANIVEKRLTSLGRHTYTLDGDNIRHGLNRDLGFTDVDRVENIRRIGEVSRLMADCGLITLVSFISPFRSERQLARQLAEDGEFIEIHVDTPLEVAEARDIKGLYKKARAGEIKNFTGIDSPYEPPENPEIRVDTVATSAEEAAEIILEKLDAWGMINSQ